MDLYLIEEEGQKKLKVDAHFSKRKQLAAIRTTCSHVQVRSLSCAHWRGSSSVVETVLHCCWWNVVAQGQACDRYSCFPGSGGAAWHVGAVDLPCHCCTISSPAPCACIKGR